MNYRQLSESIDNTRAKYNQDVGRLHGAEERLDLNLKQKAERDADEIMYREELAVILSAGAKQLNTAAETLSAAASYAVQKVFGNDYEGLSIEPDASGNSTIAKIVLRKYYNGEIMPADPFEDNGGGVCDVVSGILKFSALNSYDPPVENAFITDEMSKHVSEEYRESFALVLRELSKKLGRQVIFSTHDTALAISSDNLINF